MNTVQIRNVVIGEGRPKICVPIVERTTEEILAEARRIMALSADVVEWRADWFADADEPEQVDAALRALRSVLGETPLLFTFRTAGEGGNRALPAEEYQKMNENVAKSGCADLIDLELSSGEDVIRELIARAHACGTRVIVSSHDFSGTPEKEELLRRLRRMQELGADILKIAVMPVCRRDVLTLIDATLEMYENYAGRPVVTMSMGAAGVASRLVGEFSGSAMTFGAAGRASAPGQIPVGELRQTLEILHAAMGGKS